MRLIGILLWCFALAPIVACYAETTRLVTVTCKPVFKLESLARRITDIDTPGNSTRTEKVDPNNSTTSLVLEVDDKEVLVQWSGAIEGKAFLVFKGINLQAESTYTFTLEEFVTTLSELSGETLRAGDTEIRWYKIAKISQGDRILFDQATCEVTPSPRRYHPSLRMPEPTTFSPSKATNKMRTNPPSPTLMPYATQH